MIEIKLCNIYVIEGLYLPNCIIHNLERNFPGRLIQLPNMGDYIISVVVTVHKN